MNFSVKQLHQLKLLAQWVDVQLGRAVEASNLSIQGAHERLALKYIEELAEHYGYELRKKVVHVREVTE